MKTLLTIHPIADPIENLEPIIQVAGEMGAHLDILVLGIQLPIAVVAAPGAIDTYWVEEFLQVSKDVNRRVSLVEELVQKVGLSASVVNECATIGTLEALVSQHALCADSVMFLNGDLPKKGVAKRLFYGAVFGASRPAIILGSGNKPLPEFNRVLFAWDNEPESAKALHCSLQWIETPAEAHVLVVDPDGVSSGPNPGDGAAAFLARRNLKVSVDRMPSVGKTIAEVILEHATDINADLIVMGAYGHSRLREWLLGGTTREVFEKAKIPVFTAH
jgi:nucleotide-binding universal stress UspA family protein